MWVLSPDLPAALFVVYQLHVILRKGGRDILRPLRFILAAYVQEKAALSSSCGSGGDQMLQYPVYVRSSFLT